MAKNLLIVESPAKAKTIEKILGEDFEVRSSYGHVRDLDKDNMGVDVSHNYTPKYIIPDDKKKVVSELKSQAKKADEVWLASDEDREGEAISWHLAEVLGLDPKTTKRIVFHEITKPAIQKAVQNPRTIDMNLVDAQQARRILDRLVGFELSPVLWRKVGMQRSLSAGRVQSVAVRLIAEREREINAFNAVSTFKIEANLVAKDINNKAVNFKADGPAKIENQEDATKFLESCKNANYKVTDVQVKPAKRTPAPPFTTSTLQQEASRKLGYSVSRTMRLAQELYENGLITYMRTDAVNLSELAMAEIEKEINTAYGQKYHKPRHYKNKNQSAQEAHEAIRPTYISNHTISDGDTRSLYNLIWKRTIASQMSDAEFERTNAKIEISTNKELLSANGEVLKFDGFLKVYMEGRDDEDEEEKEGILPNLTVGQMVDLKEMLALEKYSRPSARYTEASLVKKLEELGIGRPSTYAPTISTVMKRNYVEKRDKDGTPREVRQLKLTADNKIEKKTVSENFGAEKNKLFPTDLGLVVTDFLSDHFKTVMDYNFTANVENEFDDIAGGKLKWNSMIDGFYQPFHNNVESTMENADRVKGERELGVAEDGKKIIARMGRFGPMVQIGSVDDEEKPRFAALRKDQSIETITLEEALELFKLPRNIGKFEGEDVVINVGRFGPYAQHDKKFYSLTKEMDPYSVELEEVGPLIVEKRKAKDERTIKVFEKEKIQVLRGPYGPYLKVGLRNYKLNKEQQEKAETISVDEAKAIIEEQKANPPKKKAPAKRKKTS
ncbi:MAG: type I DNA topoisomerase [Pseudopedobacter saltans]|uniref:DNA topoisomerase 1 n=1 Tax=Pseudopedobacter saltans TaxID=151895 RepID=A0A2W5F9T7_9SPHI|nr:MAG: type I DNA topoisomerase [Pseudopedobacter saltans]